MSSSTHLSESAEKRIVDFVRRSLERNDGRPTTIVINVAGSHLHLLEAVPEYKVRPTRPGP